MNHGPVLIPDSTILIQMGLFLTAYALMSILVFKPYLRLLARRRARTSDLVKQSEKARLRAAELTTSVELAMREERKKINSWLEEEKKKISEEERVILSKARHEASSEMEVARHKINEEVVEARQKLAPMVQDYASQIATRLLGRKVVVSAAATRGQTIETEQRIPT